MTPPQNDFLLPFLNILGDGQTYTRITLMLQLVKHVNVNQAETE